MAQPPTVSVLIPTYKYAQYLPQAIESVLSQSYSDFELIISDDASDDGSAEIANEYARRDDRIRFTRQPSNLGMVANWNWCLAQATGLYIKYLFGDDFLIGRDALSVLVSLMEAHPDVTLAASARTTVNENSETTATWNEIGEGGVYDGNDMISWSLRANSNLIGEPSVTMFRKADAGTGFDASLRQLLDWQLWIRLLQKGNLAFTDRCLCAFRRHGQQQTEVNRQLMGSTGEHATLVARYSEYLVRSPAERQLAFACLYRVQKKKNPEPFEVEWAQVARKAIGQDYARSWMRYKLHRPLYKLERAWQKHVLGLSLAAEPPPQLRAAAPIRKIRTGD